MTLSEKLEAAKAFLGRKWLFHPDNRLRRTPRLYDPLRGDPREAHEPCPRYVKQEPSCES